jgi:glutamate 5-kinase
MRGKILASARRVVVKIGSSLITSKDQGLLFDRIDQLAADVAALRATKREVLVVSSGAVATGLHKLGIAERPKSLPIKQAAAAVGQSRLMWAYEKAFERLNLKVAQILLTHQDLEDRRRFLNARHTLGALLKFGVVPIINENDTVAVEEIRVGDNDNLAGQVAHLIDADALVILSDVDGLYTADPRRDASATMISVVPEITPAIERLAGGAGSVGGTGGMVTKLEAAKKVAGYGGVTLILSGTSPNLLSRAFEGEEAGTLFLPRKQALKSRKHWIAFTLRSKGQVVVDAGAEAALAKGGKSLLASGIVEVAGRFEAGDVVSCVNPQGEEFGKGLVNFDSTLLREIKGLKTADIRKTFGPQEYEEVIHRDNLVIL